MSSLSHYSLIATNVAAIALLSVVTSQAQMAARNATSSTFASLDSSEPSGLSSPATPTVPTTKSPQWHETVVPEDKQINAKVTSGVLTVDGLVVKVHLNYDIHHASYIYFFVPGVGTAVVSRVETYGSNNVPGALHGNMLAFTVDGHSFELSNQTTLGEGKGAKSDVYVYLDTATVALDRTPMIGFGSTTHAPYTWPLSGHQAKDTEAHFVEPPAIPANLLPRTTPPVGTSAATTTATTATTANDPAVKR